MTRGVPGEDRPKHLDLGARQGDVARLARQHREWRAALRLGWDEEDLDQEVLLRLVRKSRSAPSRYNPQRSKVSSYLYMATRSVLRHILETTQIKARGGPGGLAARELLGKRGSITDPRWEEQMGYAHELKPGQIAFLEQVGERMDRVGQLNDAVARGDVRLPRGVILDRSSFNEPMEPMLSAAGVEEEEAREALESMVDLTGWTFEITHRGSKKVPYLKVTMRNST